MSSNNNLNNPNPVPDYSSAAQWAENYTKNLNNKDSNDNSINIFWITKNIFFYIICYIKNYCKYCKICEYIRDDK